MFPRGWNASKAVFRPPATFPDQDEKFTVGKWKLDVEPKLRYLERSLAARGGLWGNHGYEAAYAMAWTDGDGTQLDGTQRYELRFERTPPVGAFWSVTMYDTPDFYLVANPIHRYSIGGSTPGLILDDDGALTITISHERPAGEKEAANWLPSPAGDVRPVMRMYEPDASILEQGYEFPPIARSWGAIAARRHLPRASPGTTQPTSSPDCGEAVNAKRLNATL